MDNRSYSRDASYLYTIESEPNYHYYAGSIPDCRQVLMTIQIPHILALFFDQAGSFLSIEERLMCEETRTVAERYGLDTAFRDEADRELTAWSEEIEFELSQILVKRFFLPDYHIGIVDFPEYFQEVLRDPLRYSDHDRAVASEELPRWAKEGQFVLWLDEETNYWIDHTGRVVAS